MNKDNLSKKSFLYIAKYCLLFIFEHNRAVPTDITTNQTHVSYRK